MAVETSPSLPSLGAHQVVATLPEFDAEELYPACELLCQEGFTTWSVPIDRLGDLTGLLALFSRRVRIGIHGVDQVAEVKKAAAAGAAFAASPFGNPRLVKAVAGFPVILGGLTPIELRAGLDAGAAAVQVFPVEAHPPAYARVLPRLLGYPPVLASGGMDAHLAAAWLEAGAVGVWPSELFSTDLLVGSSLDALRAHLHHWRLGD